MRSGTLRPVEVDYVEIRSNRHHHRRGGIRHRVQRRAGAHLDTGADLDADTDSYPPAATDAPEHRHPGAHLDARPHLDANPGAYSHAYPHAAAHLDTGADLDAATAGYPADAANAPAHRHAHAPTHAHAPPHRYARTDRHAGPQSANYRCPASGQ